MASVTLTKDSDTCTLPAPEPGASERPFRAQSTGRTAAGASVVADGGLERTIRKETFASLTTAQKNALAAFFHDTAVGMQNTFTYTDAWGTARTVRFAKPEIEIACMGKNLYDATIELEEIPA